MVLGVITARGGSKGIPGKNMVDLAGRPLLDYTLETAEACRELDRIILSTDIPEAMEWSRRRYRRIEAPFVRPKKLCGAKVTQDEVVLHAVRFVEQGQRQPVKTVVLLQPTSPFRKIEEVNDAIRLFRRKHLHSLIGVSRVLHHPCDCVYRARGRQSFDFVFRKASWKQRQDFPAVFFMTGTLYICRTEFLKKTHAFYNRTSYLFEMSDESMMDIDRPFDLELARAWACRRNSELAPAQ